MTWHTIIAQEINIYARHCANCPRSVFSPLIPTPTCRIWVFFYYLLLFIYLAARGLSCGMWDLVP